ncbi:MAG TPA: crossover junction endodeoxyribonuclease RuvC, partial [Puia sp.]|nr:crossover junction endodeoxyribonuclease RuvC [Puia sp.]
GNGNSEKEQVWKMLQQILRIEGKPPAYDASDALAVAVCHFFQYRKGEMLADAAKPAGKTTGAKGKKAGSWEAFIRQNPEKIRTR